MGVFVIAEIGSSPAPDWNFPPWVSAAKASGADALKGQMFKAEHFPPWEQEAKRAVEFPRDRLAFLGNLVRAHGLKFGMSVFDTQAVGLAARHCDFLKLAAREQHNLTLIPAVFSHGLPVYRSVSFLPNVEVGASKNKSVTTLFAIQKYSASMAESLWRLLRFAVHCNQRGYRWGWSSHTTSAMDCILAARLGASAIEKHLCLSANDVEAGHSLLPEQFKAMVERIRR